MRRPSGTPPKRLGWLTVRADYLAMNDGQRWVTPFFVIQVRKTPIDTPLAWRVGFTASRKVGGAVVRNRARRRLREAVRLHLPLLMQPGHDVVLIARTAAAVAPFHLLVETLGWALKRLKLTPEI